MVLVASCLLGVVSCDVCVVCRLLFVLLLLVVCCSMFVHCRLLVVEFCMLFDDCFALCVVC